jgi:hypothetical protein
MLPGRGKKGKMVWEHDPKCPQELEVASAISKLLLQRALRKGITWSKTKDRGFVSISVTPKTGPLLQKAPVTFWLVGNQQQAKEKGKDKGKEKEWCWTIARNKEYHNNLNERCDVHEDQDDFYKWLWARYQLREMPALNEPLPEQAQGWKKVGQYWSREGAEETF